jgi:hypothetical protein
MLPPPAANDNRGASRAPATAEPVRAPDRLRAEILGLQARAEQASLDGLAFILAMAAREANRAASWEGRVLSELSSGAGGNSRRRPVTGNDRPPLEACQPRSVRPRRHVGRALADVRRGLGDMVEPGGIEPPTS